MEETGGNNYSTHYKNLETLVKNVNTHVLSKLHGSSTPSSTSNPPRYIGFHFESYFGSVMELLGCV